MTPTSRLFGTDGIRGRANRDLTPELAFKVGFSVVGVLARHRARPRILIGRDTRISGEMLESAISAGVAAAGGDAELLGVMPTAAIALLTRDGDAEAGVVLSASHNPMEDNGIKIFHSSGNKLPDAVEDEIEEAVVNFDTRATTRPEGRDVGRVTWQPEALDRYIRYLLDTNGVDLTGKRLVLDCANGAASEAAPRIFEACGAHVRTFFNQPDGYNINEGCGSTHPERLAELVVSEGADLGLAFDGDADRLIAVDEWGGLINGDVIMAACAGHMARKHELKENSLVATVMSNKGFHQAMKEAGITVNIAPVGDRYVLEEMIRLGLNLGGEQSGHVIFLDHSPTGDGLLTALRFCAAWRDGGERVSEIADKVPQFPQVLVNVTVSDRGGLERSALLKERIAQVEKELGENGRVLVRPSGTEPLVRVMVEAPTEQEAEGIARELAAVIVKEMG